MPVFKTNYFFVFYCFISVCQSFRRPDSLTFYDYTSQIKAYLDGEPSENLNDTMDFAKVISSDTDRQHVYYSTDSLIGDASNLSPVADFLHNATGGNSSLLLSFRLMKKGALNPQIFQDIFHKTSEDFVSDDRDAEFESLRQQVTGVILDFRSDSERTCPNGTLMDYFKRQNISFVQYAKGQLGAMLSSEETSAKYVKVGVQFLAQQLQECDEYIRSQITHADFVVVTFDWKTISKSPLSVEAVGDPVDATNRFLKNLISSGRRDTNVIFHFNLEKDSSIVEAFQKDDKTGDTIRSIVEDSHDSYFFMLEHAVQNWIFQQRHKHMFHSLNYELVPKTDHVILGYNDDYKKAIGSRAKLFQRIHSKRHFIPYLNLHESDVSQCALQTIAVEMKRYQKAESENIVVNEYTWNAIVQLESKMKLSNLSCDNSTTYNPDDDTKASSIDLILSEGIGSVWDFAKDSLLSLLKEHKTSLGFQLSTIFFRARDILDSVCGRDCKKFLKGDKYNLPRTGILEFIDDLQNSTEYKLGCLVDFGHLRQVNGSASIKKTSAVQCSPILESTGKVIWKFEIDIPEEVANFTLSFNFRFTPSSQKYKLFQIFIARKQFMEQYPGTEVVIQLQPDNHSFRRFGLSNHSNMSMPMTIEDHVCPRPSVENYLQTMRLFSIVHDVPMILRPLYDVKNPWFGKDIPPAYDGKVHRRYEYLCGNTAFI